MLDTALIPDGESLQEWRSLMKYPQGTKIGLIGRLELDENCFTIPPKHTCTPVRKPIFIGSFRASIAVPNAASE
jgi:hypothetical protein